MMRTVFVVCRIVVHILSMNSNSALWFRAWRRDMVSATCGWLTHIKFLNVLTTGNSSTKKYHTDSTSFILSKKILLLFSTRSIMVKEWTLECYNSK